ncbi:MAG: amidohydrolase [Dehalococcoidia bacterium]|nr:amidohydrolase [Dehalococcoidia bacterium]
MIIDFHTHIFPPWLRLRREEYLARDATFGELFASPKARMATAERLIRRMDEDGVDVSVVMGIGWTDIDLARAANDYLIEAVAKHPDRLVGFAGVNPAWGTEAVQEARRCAEEGLRGIGELHPDTQGYDLGDLDTMAPLMEVVREYGLIVTTHSSEPVGHEYPGKGRTYPGVLWRFIRNFPDATIVCAHWGGGLPFYALMPEVVDGLNHTYFDSAATTLLYDGRIFETVASVIGPERILMGSDYPLIGANKIIGQVESSALSRSAKDMILGGNAVRLLGK